MPTSSRQGSGKQNLPKISRKTALEVLELQGKDIFEVQGALTEAESQAYVQFAEGLGFQHQSSRGAAFGEVKAFRSNDRTSIQSKELADLLWRNAGLQDIFQGLSIGSSKARGLNPNIRFYRYTAGHRFGKHVDDSNRVGAFETRYTLLIYLSGSNQGEEHNGRQSTALLRGGETLFYGGKRSKLVASVKPQAGLALLHLHGDDCLEHEGAEVISGVKYVLRSDVLFD